MNKDSIGYKACLLGILCAVCGALLAITNDITAPVIAEQALAAEKENLEKIYPGGNFTEVTDFNDHDGMIEKVFTVDGGGTIYKLFGKGYNANGFTFMIAFDDDGKCTGFTAVEQSESPGIGARAFEDDYVNEISSITVDDDAPLISGASLTTGAIRQCVAAAEDEWHATH